MNNDDSTYTDGDISDSNLLQEKSSLTISFVFDLTFVPDGNKIRVVKIGDTRISIDARSDHIKISSVRTPKAKRNKGSARNAMLSLVNQADAEGVLLMLDASELDKRTTHHRLIKFYESLGFKKTGTTINFLQHPEMARYPNV